MTWINCGTVDPDHFEWKLFDYPLVGGEVFRVRHTNGIYMSWGYALLAFFYSIGSESGRYGYKRIYPRWVLDGHGEDYEIFISPIPPQLEEMGVQVRYAGVTLPAKSPRTIPTWSISLDAKGY
jgi:hypothetical protein